MVFVVPFTDHALVRFIHLYLKLIIKAGNFQCFMHINEMILSKELVYFEIIEKLD